MTDVWLKCPKPNPQARLRLFCFPYAGGRASIFRAWPERLPTSVEVCPVELPGRGTRIKERPYDQLLPLVRTLADVLLPRLDKPFAFFGHSLGALISFELTRQLRRQHGPGPVHLFVSGARAPHVPKPRAAINDLPESEFLEALRRLNGTPRAVLEHSELMQILIPILRADFAVSETYAYTKEPPLDCPVSVFGGMQDRGACREHLEAWPDQTRSSFSLWMLPGDHFFLHSSEPRLLGILSHELHRRVRSISCRGIA
jgi:medium-chain acyl-[acyl-carrier-protein] hydrolase